MRRAKNVTNATAYVARRIRDVRFTGLADPAVALSRS